MDDDDAELRNPFPSPPSHYTKYTSHNLHLLDLLKERVPDTDLAFNQHEILKDQMDVPDWPLTQLEKPRVDWILKGDEPYYDVFGDRWFVQDKIPSLAELGGQQLYPEDPNVDRRPALQTILRSMLVTYSNLTSALLAPPPTQSSSAPPEWQKHVEWITILGQNLMASANDLRPVQARGNLEMMMKRQLELRRDETRVIHMQVLVHCKARLLELRASAEDLKQSKSITSHFEDENQVDAPLAPLPDEPEVVEIEEEEESQPVVGEKAQADATEVSETIQEPEDSKPPSPKPQLMMSTESTMEDITDTGDGLDASLNPMDTSGMGGEKMSTEGMDLDLSALGPDGLALVDVGDLSQIEVEDGLMGGPNMDDTIDPFAAESTITMDEK
ncbi:MED7 protein-domain-containing protein [Lentinula aciculospora]|uniref:Mediator of RNA polymerase II transcription subunit 7 n=1 Tax=Lentinula aciculospora TaxID=153920 RepID=A0A9W9ANW3_9AGAR|nr:MED7 protein-domain-containing protein [Lentinula aciculospora]